MTPVAAFFFFFPFFTFINSLVGTCSNLHDFPPLTLVVYFPAPDSDFFTFINSLVGTCSNLHDFPPLTLVVYFPAPDSDCNCRLGFLASCYDSWNSLRTKHIGNVGTLFGWRLAVWKFERIQSIVCCQNFHFRFCYRAIVYHFNLIFRRVAWKLTSITSL